MFFLPFFDSSFCFVDWLILTSGTLESLSLKSGNTRIDLNVQNNKILNDRKFWNSFCSHFRNLIFFNLFLFVLTISFEESWLFHPFSTSKFESPLFKGEKSILQNSIKTTLLRTNLKSSIEKKEPILYVLISSYFRKLFTLFRRSFASLLF